MKEEAYSRVCKAERRRRISRRGWKDPKGFAVGQDTAATGPTVIVRPDAPGMDTAEPPIEYQLDVTKE